MLSYALSILLTSIIVLYFLLSSNELIHYFIIPTYFAGIIIGLDLIDWFRGKMDVFDPVGFLGLFGYHFFFIAPLLQVHWDFGMSFVNEPEDWRVWLFWLSLINLIGLVIYRLLRNYLINNIKKRPVKIIWKLNSNRLLAVSLPLLIFMLLLHTYIYISFGGISGYIDT